jgi:glycosyltransferase involved in cell wall biosynthesis
MNNPLISVIIPVLNEEGSIEIQNKKIKKAFSGKIDYEVIWIDDGSTDRTAEILKNISTNDPRVTGLSLMRRVGQSGALMAGIDKAKGQYIATMDGDNQNDPYEFLDMLDLLKKENLDAVVGWRKDRWKGNIIRRIPSLIANTLLRKSFKAVQIHDAGCPIKLVETRLLKEIRLYGELHRFLSYLLYRTGAHIGEMPVKHRERSKGQSKYGISRTFKVLFDIINVKFLTMSKVTPIQVMGPIALILYIISFGFIGFLIYSEFTRTFDVSGSPYFLLSIMLFILATQFIIFGLLGELILRSYYENGKEKKTYLIRNEYK